MDPVRVLTANGFLQLGVSSLLGFWMLVPRQPWGRALARRGPRPRDLMAVHLDLIVLGLTQLAAAWTVAHFAVHGAEVIAILLVAGGWLNPTPYLVRGFGIDAFVLAGPSRQRVAALLGLGSSLGLLAAFAMLVVALLAP